MCALYLFIKFFLNSITTKLIQVTTNINLYTKRVKSYIKLDWIFTGIYSTSGSHV